MIKEHYLKEIDIRLRESWFSEETPGAYETAIGIIYLINNRKELDPYLIKYDERFKKTFESKYLNVWNLLAEASRFFQRLDPIPFKKGEEVFVFSKIYKEKYEPAVITEIDYKEYLVTVRPIRDRADEYRICPDWVAATTERALRDKMEIESKREVEEELKKKSEKKEIKIEQLTIFDLI